MDTRWQEAEAGDRPVILVLGAARGQGRGVVRHLLARGRFAVRAMVRNPTGMAAHMLREMGAEVVGGSLDDRDSLRAAMQYVHGVYGVIDLWDYFDGDYAQGVNLADAVGESYVDHFVFSSLPGAGELSRTHLGVRPTELTRRIEAYVRGLALPATFVHAPWFYDDFLGAFLPRPHADGGFRIRLPQGAPTLAGVATEDVGGVAAAIFERPSQMIGRTVRIVGDEHPPEWYAARMSAATGRRIAVEPVPHEALATVAGGCGVADVLEFARARPGDRVADLVRSRELYPDIQRFESWLDRHRERVRAAIAR